MRFDELRLAEPIVRAVAAQGYSTPTPIQEKAIPPILEGKDLLGCAQTGTGKTGAFAMPILDRLSRPPQGSGGAGRSRARGRAPRALVLCPTRELASQISESFRAYGEGLHLRDTVVFGGVSQAKQVGRLRNGTDILVATPGRLLDLMNQGLVDLRSVEILVLDEADRMLDMGFIRDIRRVVGALPDRRQTLLFSATMPAEIRGLADSLLQAPVFVKSAPVATPAEAIQQSVYLASKANKAALLERLLTNSQMTRTLVFTRTKHGADKLVKYLSGAHIDAAAIHGNKTQGARTRALAGFKSGHTRVLVATDIASRGIDVDRITHVVNFDVPNEAETYVHRIGRTARAGESGIAISFCDQQELGDLRAIERLMGMQIEIRTDEPELTYEAPARSTPAPRSGSGPRRAKGRGGRGRARPSRGAQSGASNGPRRTRRPRRSKGASAA